MACKQKGQANDPWVVSDYEARMWRALKQLMDTSREEATYRIRVRPTGSTSADPPQHSDSDAAQSSGTQELPQVPGENSHEACEHAWAVGNALTESLLLHTRILTDMLLPKNSKPPKTTKTPDIKLDDLPCKQSCEIDRLRIELESAYHDKGPQGRCLSPRETLNKLLAHPANIRTSRHDYTSLFESLKPKLDPLINKTYEGQGKD